MPEEDLSPIIGLMKNTSLKSLGIIDIKINQWGYRALTDPAKLLFVYKCSLIS